jgi:hypothetical protein
MGDASLKDGQCSHAWILSMGEPDDINNINMSIHGHGAVDGDISTMSSTRGELHSQTAMAIMSNLFLSAHNDRSTRTVMYGDNKGVQQTCSNTQINKLKLHRQPNMDLKTEYKKATANRIDTNTWIKGHQDQNKQWTTIADLQHMKLSNLAIMNTVCDRKANEARRNNLSFPDADVYPTEKWALFSSHPATHKNTGQLDHAILGIHNTDEMKQYIKRKHDISEEMLSQVDVDSLHSYLRSKKMHNRANIVKLIHRWVPTQVFLNKQHRTTTPICPRCNSHNEDFTHVLQCPDQIARDFRQQAIYQKLHNLVQLNTNIETLHALEDKITEFLQVDSLVCFSPHPHTMHPHIAQQEQQYNIKT